MVRVKKPISLHFNGNLIIWVIEETCSADLASSTGILLTDFPDSFYSFPWLRCPHTPPSLGYHNLQLLIFHKENKYIAY